LLPQGKLGGKTGFYPEAYAETFQTMIGEDGKPITNMNGKASSKNTKQASTNFINAQ